MSPTIPRLEDLPIRAGTRVLVRIDCNTPLHDGEVADDLRLTTVIPTIEWLTDRKASVVLCGHLGRPQGEPDPVYSLAPVARRLGKLLGTDVALTSEAVSFETDRRIADLRPGDVLLL